MQEQNFNPVIEAVVSIRHLAISLTENWTIMKKSGTSIQNNLEQASNLVNDYAKTSTKENWQLKLSEYHENLDFLKQILNTAIEKIKAKNASGLFEEWEKRHEYGKTVSTKLRDLEAIGSAVMPENTKESWTLLWEAIHDSHDKIQNEAEACSMQLKMIEVYRPNEIDELTDTILKNIPIKYTKAEAHKYADEYMKAYEAIKAEALQKKNLWDKFLDILAGGIQQTPAQRVMMQRWVDGEKGELH